MTENPFLRLENRLIVLENLLADIKRNGIHPPEQIIQQPELLEYISKSEAKKLLGCSGSKIDKDAREGRLKRYYLGRSVRFKRCELMALISETPNQ